MVNELVALTARPLAAWLMHAVRCPPQAELD